MNNQPDMNAPDMDAKPSVGKNSFGFVFVFVIVLILAVALTALATFSYTINEFCHVTDENSVKLQTITRLIEENSYYDAEYEAMLEAALKAYVGASGDRYTTYYTEEEYAAITQNNKGEYVGIGVTISEKTVEYNGRYVDVLEVVRMPSDSPAALAGVLVGDCIYAVESAEGGFQAVNDVGRDAATNLIRGEVGTPVKVQWLTLEGTEYVLREAEMIRKNVQSTSVVFNVSATNPEVGVVSIYQFDLTTPKQLMSAFDTLSSEDIKRVVLDLRDNGGGDLLSVIACASYFVENGDVILSTEDKDGNENIHRAVRRIYETNDPYSACNVYDSDIGKYRDFHVAVLINENTASAAELLAAVFRDYDLAKLIGVKTFGKGSMQTQFDLKKYGIEGCLKVTTNLYFPPSGISCNGVGIAPDIVVEADAISNEDIQLLRAIEEVIKA